jgi:hypothetical protein
LISLPRGLGLLLLALALAGCAVKSACRPGPYQEARATPPLVLPEGADRPDQRAALRVPPPSDRPDSDGCPIEPPRFYAEAGEPNPDGLPIRPGSLEGRAPAARRTIAPAQVTREVTAFIESWADAWSRRDFQTWALYYEPEFAPEGYSNKDAWRADQARRFQIPATTRVDSGSVEVDMLTGGSVRARFTQHFSAGGEDRSVLKELVLKPYDGATAWLIVNDRVIDFL